MFALRKLCGVALLAAAVLGCDSSQPLQVGEETYELAVRAGDATVPVYNVYDMFEDSPRCQGDPTLRCAVDLDCGAAAPCLPSDNAPDDATGDGQPDTFLWCLNTGTTAVAGSVPFFFTIEVTVLRAGQLEREALTSTTALSDETDNLSDYDSLVPVVPGSPPVLPPVTVGPPTASPPRTYRFANGRRRSAADRAVVAATSNPLSTLLPGTYGVGNGRCSAGDPGPAVIDRSLGAAYPLPIVLGKGDTVTVKARRGITGPATIPIANKATVSLSASFRSGGRPVSVTGTLASSAGAGADLVFTFTSR